MSKKLTTRAAGRAGSGRAVTETSDYHCQIKNLGKRHEKRFILHDAAADGRRARQGNREKLREQT